MRGSLALISVGLTLVLASCLRVTGLVGEEKHGSTRRILKTHCVWKRSHVIFFPDLNTTFSLYSQLHQAPRMHSPSTRFILVTLVHSLHSSHISPGWRRSCRSREQVSGSFERCGWQACQNTAMWSPQNYRPGLWVGVVPTERRLTQTVWRASSFWNVSVRFIQYLGLPGRLRRCWLRAGCWRSWLPSCPSERRSPSARAAGYGSAARCTAPPSGLRRASEWSPARETTHKIVEVNRGEECDSL